MAARLIEGPLNCGLWFVSCWFLLTVNDKVGFMD